MEAQVEEALEEEEFHEVEEYFEEEEFHEVEELLKVEKYRKFLTWGLNWLQEVMVVLKLYAK